MFNENGILEVECNLIFNFIAIGLLDVFLGFILNIEPLQTIINNITIAFKRRHTVRSILDTVLIKIVKSRYFSLSQTYF